ncbi:MAG: hypothetical protein ACC682_07380 [Gemmatimonadota bacterium]
MELFGINDPDVALTDYAITLLCLWIMWRIRSGPGLGRTRPWLLVFYGGIALAAAFGGTVHGFFEFEGTAGYDILWPATLISMGVAALGGWGLGARLVLKDGLGSALIGLASLEFLAYSGAVIGGYQGFEFAVLQYLPATAFLTIAVIVAERRTPRRGFREALLGMVLTFAAAAVLRLELHVHPVLFDHNAVYHVVQAAALIFFYRGMTRASAKGR